MVYPKIYRPLMGTRGTFFFIFKFLPFCFQFLIRFKTYAYFWAYQFFSFFFSTQKNSSNYGSPMCRGQEKSSASTMSTTFAFFPLPWTPYGEKGEFFRYHQNVVSADLFQDSQAAHVLKATRLFYSFPPYTGQMDTWERRSNVFKLARFHW